GWRYVQLVLGRIRAQVQKHLGGSPGFQIGTPSAVISVRGTRFDVEVDRRGITEVDVEEGVVELDALGGRGGSVLITAGFSSRVGAESAPEVPRPTHDLRPEVDRPGGHGKDSGGDDDPIKKLEARDREHRDRDSGDHNSGSGGGASGSGNDGGGSGSGSSGGGQSGSDGGGDKPGSGSDGGDRDGGDKHGSGKPPETN
ncbi:MAG: FecR domain-containing protein, partial [Terriglobales bacterium]